MSKAAPNNDETKFDLRLLSQRLAHGDVTAAEYEKFLKALPDDAENAEEAKASFVSPYADQHKR